MEVNSLFLGIFRRWEIQTHSWNPSLETSSQHPFWSIQKLRIQISNELYKRIWGSGEDGRLSQIRERDKLTRTEGETTVVVLVLYSLLPFGPIGIVGTVLTFDCGVINEPNYTNLSLYLLVKISFNIGSIKFKNQVRIFFYWISPDRIQTSYYFTRLAYNVLKFKFFEINLIRPHFSSHQQAKLIEFSNQVQIC